MSAIDLQGLPGDLGRETDYKTGIIVASKANPGNSNQANQAVVALALGTMQSQHLASLVAAKTGLLQDATRMSDGKNFDYQGFQGSVVSKINPMVLSYLNMNPSNQQAFWDGLGKIKGARAEFRKDATYVQSLMDQYGDPR
jgi:hypothetical protein